MCLRKYINILLCFSLLLFFGGVVVGSSAPWMYARRVSVLACVALVDQVPQANNKTLPPKRPLVLSSNLSRD